MEFGTGVMTITPWHSIADFELAEKYNLEKEQVIDKYGKLLPIAGEFAGLKLNPPGKKSWRSCRQRVVRKDRGLHAQHCNRERTGAIIEPQIMEQWFISVDKKFTIPHSEIPGIKSGSETTFENINEDCGRKRRGRYVAGKLRKIYFTGLKISMTGAFPGRSGTDTEFRYGINKRKRK